jgi:chromosome segregation ATPase
MNQEKFVNVYIDLLNTTLTEAIQKNIVAQAKNRVFENDVADYEKRVSEIEINNKEILQQKEEHIQTLVSQINDARRQLGAMTTRLEENKTSSEHFETYKNELINCRKKNEELLELIQEKDKLITEKDKKLEEFGAGPKPVVLNKLEKKAPTTLETKVDKTKTIKVKSVKDAGSF